MAHSLSQQAAFVAELIVRKFQKVQVNASLCLAPAPHWRAIPLAMVNLFVFWPMKNDNNYDCIVMAIINNKGKLSDNAAANAVIYLL